MSEGMYRVRASPPSKDARRPYLIVRAFGCFGVVTGTLPTTESGASIPKLLGWRKTEQAAEAWIQRLVDRDAGRWKAPKARLKLVALVDDG